MAHTNPSCYHLSASSIASFKACPTRFRLAYREGLRTVEDTDAQRVGTNWHAMHETYANVGLEAWGNKELSLSAEDCKEAALQAVIALLNEAYSRVPAYKTPAEFALEREQLLTCFMGYLWYYQNDPIEYLANELPFELPLHMPRSGMPLPTSEVVRVGKIDHVIRWQGSVGALERKSTSRGIGPDSDYWDKAKKDTQVSMYALAFQDLCWCEMLPEGVAAHIKGETPARYGNTLYDVWHKPTIKPAMLTQKETEEFIGEQVYFGQKFSLGCHVNGVFWKDLIPLSQAEGSTVEYFVDGEPAEIAWGKSGKPAIRETVAMYGARLLADIYERPDFYFVRREIARTDIEIRQFREQLFAIYTAQKAYARHDMWFENESQCRATFPCPYIPICYGPGADAVCDGKTTPNGFKRIFVDLTVNGEPAED